MLGADLTVQPQTQVPEIAVVLGGTDLASSVTNRVTRHQRTRGRPAHRAGRRRSAGLARGVLLTSSRGTSASRPSRSPNAEHGDRQTMKQSLALVGALLVFGCGGSQEPAKDPASMTAEEHAAEAEKHSEEAEKHEDSGTYRDHAAHEDMADEHEKEAEEHEKQAEEPAPAE